MVTVHRENGFEFVVRTRDHTPPHVHVFYGNEEVLLYIVNEGETPTVYRIKSMSRQNLRRALLIAARNNEKFLTEWRRIYG